MGNNIETKIDELKEIEKQIKENDKAGNIIKTMQLKIKYEDKKAEFIESIKPVIESYMNDNQLHIFEESYKRMETDENTEYTMYYSFFQLMKSYGERLKKQKEIRQKDEIIIEGLPSEIRNEVENIMWEQHESGLAYINDSPVVKTILRPEKESKEKKEIKLSGTENAVFTLIDGFIDPYEKEILETVSKYKRDGQIMQNGKIFCTVGQMYRAMRGGANVRPTSSQKEEIMSSLREMSKDERKLSFEVDEYLQIWGGFEMKGGRLRLISYDEFFGRIRGQEDTLIVFDETPLLCALSENTNMFEEISQEIKAIQIEDNGKLKTWKLSKNRISLRSVIFSFVFQYIRAIWANKNCSNKKPYNSILEVSKINDNRQQIIRAKKDIAVILNHLQRMGVITSWNEYYNKRSEKPDGIEIYVSKSIIEKEFEE